MVGFAPGPGSAIPPTQFYTPPAAPIPPVPIPNTGPIQVTHLTNGENQTSVTNINTASISPAGNCLIILAVSDFTGSVVATVTGCGLTWVHIADATDSTGFHIASIYRAMGAAPTPGVVNISYGVATNRIGWTIEQFSGVDTTGTNGSGAVVQSGTTPSAPNATPNLRMNASISLNPFGSPNNVIYGFLFTTVLGQIFPRGGFTELYNFTGDGQYESQWAYNQNYIEWNFLPKVSSFDQGFALEIKAGIVYLDTQGSDSADTLVIRSRYNQPMQAAIFETTQPTEPIFQTVTVGVTFFDFHVFDDTPLRADVIGASLRATTQPIWPRAPPRPANLTFGTGSGVSATTASIAPNANDLVIVSVTGGSGNGQVPTVSGAGGTWVLIASQFDGGGVRGVHMFRDLSPTPGSGALTIDFGGISQTFIAWSVNAFSGVDRSGTHGSGAVLQSVGNFQTSTNTGFTITLATFGSVNNTGHGYLRNTALGAISPSAGMTKLSDDANGQNAEYGLNQSAVGWTWPSQVNTSVALAIEIKALSVGALTPSNWIQNPDATLPDQKWGAS